MNSVVKQTATRRPMLLLYETESVAVEKLVFDSANKRNMKVTSMYLSGDKTEERAVRRVIAKTAAEVTSSE